jgi:prevent-host-death family protein
MKTKSTTIKYPQSKPSASVLKDAVALPGVGLSIPLRAAKAKLSALLELVADGTEVTITSDGEPKAVLSPVPAARGRKVFTGMGEFLLKQPMHEGSATDLVREDRDARGW